MRVALAVTAHDTGGRLAPAIPGVADGLRTIFAGVALNATHETHPDVVAAAEAHLSPRLIRHPANEATIGKARRDAVALALGLDADAIFHCDLDHLVRWAQADTGELRRIVTAEPHADLLVVGRSEKSFAAEPRRLRETEAIVNHVYGLMTGRQWDLMFAVRRLSRRAAEAIVQHSREDTLANDVEWPLLAERAGCSLGYAEADGLYYRTMEEFGAPADTHDGKPYEWVRRLEFAALNAAVFRAYLRGA